MDGERGEAVVRQYPDPGPGPKTTDRRLLNPRKHPAIGSSTAPTAHEGCSGEEYQAANGHTVREEMGVVREEGPDGDLVERCGKEPWKGDAEIPASGTSRLLMLPGGGVPHG